MLESMVSLHSHVTRLGVLDIGSNTVHMLIVDAAPGARPEPEASTKSTVRLMQYLKADGTIKKAGVEAVVAAVEKAMGLVKEYEITQLLVLATSALREAPNGSRILKRIENVVGQSRCCPVWMRPDSPSLQLAAGMVGMPVGCWSSISVVVLSRWLWVRMRIPQWRCPCRQVPVV